MVHASSLDPEQPGVARRGDNGAINTIKPTV